MAAFIRQGILRAPSFVLLVSLLSGAFGCFRETIEYTATTFHQIVDAYDEVCYDGVGCFNNSLPCYAVGFPPSDPKRIDTHFYLYTQDNLKHPDIIKEGDYSTLGRFDPKRETKVIIHGWFDSSQPHRHQGIKNAFLEMGDVNVIMVDWRDGAHALYSHAVSSLRVVGRQTANLLAYLRSTYTSIAPVHIIGHSLGAHAAGYAGKDAGFIDRITGLDPAGPLFSCSLSLPCRLGPGDASFVDVIHTNGRCYGLGQIHQLGHQDFYPNGGETMPGCPGSGVRFILSMHPISTLAVEDTCDHERSTEYFASSIRRACPFNAHRSSSWDEFKAQAVSSGSVECSQGEACSRMGYYVDRNQPDGKYYLQTAAEEPFC